MKATRREFMQALGVTLASLLLSRCRPACYVPAVTPPSGGTGDLWDDLRAPWEDLDLLARDAKDVEKGQQTLDRLIAGHRSALDALVESGELDSAIADDLQTAFEAAARHVWRANAPITCYTPALYPEYGVQGASDLARQAEILAEMAAQGDLNPETVAQAQASIERDIAFLTMPAEEQQALINAVVEAAGEGMDWPTLAELDLEIPPESVEAARILVQLLLEER